MMLQSIVYELSNATTRHEKYQWADEILASLTSNEIKGKVTTHTIEHENVTITCIINNTTDPGPAHGREHQ